MVGQTEKPVPPGPAPSPALREAAGARTDLAAGDVRYVEDSLTKHRDMARFTTEFAGADQVDTRYTDFFGRNATGVVDSILVRV